MKGPGKITFRPHQWDVYRLVKDREFSLVVHKMRAGKTLPTAYHLVEAGKKTCIVCPPNVVGVWEETLTELGGDSSKIDIISDGSLSSKKPEAFQTSFHNRYKTVVFDEIHRYSAYSNRFKNAAYLRANATKVIGLSATPFERNEEGLFYVMQLLDGGELFGKNRKVFHSIFCRCLNPGSRFLKWELQEQVHQDFLEYAKEFTTAFTPKELVPPHIEETTFHLTKEQKSIIKRLDAEKEIPEIDNVNLDWTRGMLIQKINQVTSGFLHWENILQNKKTLPIDNSSKLSKFEDVLYWVIERRREKAVVWANYLEEYKIIQEVCDENNYVWVRYDPKKGQGLEEFKNEDYDVLIAHPKSAGQGIDMSFCNVAIYFSLPLSSIDYEQSLYRLTRYNEKKQNIVYILRPKGDYVQGIIKKKMSQREEFYKKVGL